VGSLHHGWIHSPLEIAPRSGAEVEESPIRRWCSVVPPVVVPPVVVPPVHGARPSRSAARTVLSSRQGRCAPLSSAFGRHPYSPEVRSRAIPRVAAPRIRRTTTARTARSESICTMATIRAGSVFGVMSPKPTVENTVTVK
jgi:hypothetical protein